MKPRGLREDDAAARYRRDDPQPRENAELVQAPHRAEMEERGTVAAARQAQPDAVPLCFRVRQVRVRGVGSYASIACGHYVAFWHGIGDGGRRNRQPRAPSVVGTLSSCGPCFCTPPPRQRSQPSAESSTSSSPTTSCRTASCGMSAFHRFRKALECDRIQRGITNLRIGDADTRKRKLRAHHSPKVG